LSAIDSALLLAGAAALWLDRRYCSRCDRISVQGMKKGVLRRLQDSVKAT
jgi:hypothetical protein